jgi:hypothetical protein
MFDAAFASFSTGKSITIVQIWTNSTKGTDIIQNLIINFLLANFEGMSDCCLMQTE